MYIPNIFVSALYFISPTRTAHQKGLGVDRALDFCPQMKVRCVKDGKWPGGIVGDIGKKDFCWEAPRCNQCDIGANTEECNMTFPECENVCEAFSPIPF
ncbi:hypothetical protein FS749_006184 [Ceratobasidium sp. UAMH 11750]|nr:hypothetical protein FS749_006184 [Ceratobasidium sp. UAMH 11750]